MTFEEELAICQRNMDKYHSQILNKNLHNVSNAVYCGRGRGSIWGNDYTHLTGTTAPYMVNSREEAVVFHRRQFIADLKANKINIAELIKLADKQVYCWCAPELCHCSTIIAAAHYFKSKEPKHIVQLTTRTNYTAKDQLKANLATKFIGRGSEQSSTNQYAKDFGILANCGIYTANDKVFVSTEGARKNRVPLQTNEVMLAINAKATIIADDPYNRNRPYNIGEKELEALLIANNYIEVKAGIWQPK